MFMLRLLDSILTLFLVIGLIAGSIGLGIAVLGGILVFAILALVYKFFGDINASSYYNAKDYKIEKQNKLMSAFVPTTIILVFLDMAMVCGKDNKANIILNLSNGSVSVFGIILFWTIMGMFGGLVWYCVSPNTFTRLIVVVVATIMFVTGLISDIKGCIDWSSPLRTEEGKKAVAQVKASHGQLGSVYEMYQIHVVSGIITIVISFIAFMFVATVVYRTLEDKYKEVMTSKNNWIKEHVFYDDSVQQFKVTDANGNTMPVKDYDPVLAEYLQKYNIDGTRRK